MAEGEGFEPSSRDQTAPIFQIVELDQMLSPSDNSKMGVEAAGIEPAFTRSHTWFFTKNTPTP